MHIHLFGRAGGRRAICGIFCAMFILGCTTTKSVNDGTVPDLSWEIRDKTDHTSTIKSGDGAVVNLAEGHSYQIILRADHPKGIRSISLSGKGEFNETGSPGKLDLPDQYQSYVRLPVGHPDTRETLTHEMDAPEYKSSIIFTGESQSFSKTASIITLKVNIQ